MEDIELLKLWKTQNEKIEKSLSINKILLREQLETKALKALRSIKTSRKVGIVFGILWCIGITFILIASWGHTNLFFKVSLIVHLAISIYAIITYIYHLALLHNFNNNQPIIRSQQKLGILQESNLRTIGILMLQLPVFSTWFITMKWIRDSPLSFWFILMPIVLVQLFFGFWCFSNLKFKNHQKKWFKRFVSRGEFATINKLMSLTSEIENINK